MSGSALLEGEGISKSFGGLRVLRDVRFAVGPAEIVALIGPNGAGKTTLFNIISGLLRASAGSIRLDGRSLTTLAPHRICRLGVGRTFQTPRPFLDLSVAVNVETAVRFSTDRGMAATDLLRLVELTDHAGVQARHLPAARRKMLELAMALAGAPRVLLIDEILGGLTAAEAGRCMTILRRIRDERRVALFWIDHLVWAVMQMAERVVVLHHGEIISEGEPRAVARDARVVEAYLGRAARQAT